MAERIVFSVVQRIGVLLEDEAKVLYYVTTQVEQIQAELKRMQCFLKDADARQDEDEKVRNWVAEIREVALDVEDTVETYAFRVSSSMEGGILRRCYSILKEPVVLHKIGSEIQVIKTKISDLTTSLQTYGVSATRERESSNSANENQRWLRRSYSHVVDEDFVGLEGDVEKLVGHLVNEERDNCSLVVCIHGMGGLGKTTLARKVYQHGNVRSHFDALAWVCISQQWQPTDVLQGILIKLIPHERENIMSMRGDELVKDLYEVQQKRKCLVVLDDVWSVDVWNILRYAFPNTQMGSKILVTTRIREVALDMDPSCFLHEPRCLNHEESWELFKKKAKSFRVGTDMEKLGREMVGRCGGLPLAVVALGGILVTKSTLRGWKMVYQTFHSILQRGKSHGRRQGSVHEVLALSYHDLPYELKPCFLYLGNFVEDSKIPTRKLFQLWEAEGFLPLVSNEGVEEETMMDVAERYLDELVQRCMVQVQVDESSGRFKSCQLHDLIRDLCLSKGEEENFLKIRSFRQERQPMDSTSSMTTGPTRRLSIHVDFDLERLFPPKQNSTNHVRSMLFSSKHGGEVLKLSLNSICNDFKLLRVLDLEGYRLRGKEVEVPQAMENLVHLRFLSFRNSRFGKFPSVIGRLRNLQTLDLRVDSIIEFQHKPDVLSKLERLRHLYLLSPYGYCEEWILGNKSKLETLKNIKVGDCNFRDVLRLTNLRKVTANLELGLKALDATINYFAITSNRLRQSSLSIEYNFRSEEEVSILRRLLGCHHLGKLILTGRISKLPECHHFSRSLSELTLRNSRLKEDPVPTLENLPKLLTLSLDFGAFLGKEMVCSSQGFPLLKTLELRRLENLEKWSVDEGAMPSLHCLKIDGCEKLEMVPEGLKFLTDLQRLDIQYMPKAFNDRLRVRVSEGGQDYYKVQRVPDIYIGRDCTGLRQYFGEALDTSEEEN